MNTANTILVISVGVFAAGWILFALAFSQWLRLYREDKELRDR